MELNLEEVLRLLGAGNSAPGEARQALRERAEGYARRLTEQLPPRYTYRVFPLVFREEGVELTGSGVCLPGELARRMLSDCDRGVLLLCTLGAGFDAMLRREQVRDMAGAVILDACGSAWVEAGCDRAQEELGAAFPGTYLTDRFSPGYGDLPLSLQPRLCAVLDGARRLGVTASEQFLLNPVKSVSAVIGLSPRPQRARIRGCAYCSLRESCTLRRGGNRCGD